MWQKGQPWRVVNSLNILNNQIRAYAPRSVPPATDADSWGSIADGAHSTSSDHYPHYYTALGATAVVCARDFPHAPGLGLDGSVVTEHLRVARDARIQYIIFNRRITGVNYSWQWHTYDGADPHDTHFHVSAIHSALADSIAAWSLPGSNTPIPKKVGERDMIYQVIAVPVNQKDVTGSVIPNNGQCAATPQGAFNYTGSEFFSLPTDAQAVRMTMPWPRFMALCNALSPTPMDTATLANDIAAAYPVSEINQQVILSALASPEGHAELIEILKSPEGQGALADAAELGIKNL